MHKPSETLSTFSKKLTEKKGEEISSNVKRKWEKLKILALRKWLIHCEGLKANCATFHHMVREQCIYLT